MTTSPCRARVIVRGRVQGVFFRAEASSHARSLRLSGWVRNRADGAVEAVFEGEKVNVESMLRWCGRGPAGARVDSVDVEWQPALGESGFAVR